jgi:hypothetical protein
MEVPICSSAAQGGERACILQALLGAFVRAAPAGADARTRGAAAHGTPPSLPCMEATLACTGCGQSPMRMLAVLSVGT